MYTYMRLVLVVCIDDPARRKKKTTNPNIDRRGIHFAAKPANKWIKPKKRHPTVIFVLC
jgi:hypothetical protein